MSDRLRRAQTERMIAAGLLPGAAALKPEPSEVDTEPQAYDFSQPIVIESPAAGLHPVADPPASSAAGDQTAPTTETALCPTCHRPGKVDIVDLVGHTSHMTCPTCRTMWQVRDTTLKH